MRRKYPPKVRPPEKGARVKRGGTRPTPGAGSPPGEVGGKSLGKKFGNRGGSLLGKFPERGPSHEREGLTPVGSEGLPLKSTTSAFGGGSIDQKNTSFTIMAEPAKKKRARKREGEV